MVHFDEKDAIGVFNQIENTHGYIWNRKLTNTGHNVHNNK